MFHEHQEESDSEDGVTPLLLDSWDNHGNSRSGSELTANGLPSTNIGGDSGSSNLSTLEAQNLPVANTNNPSNDVHDFPNLGTQENNQDLSGDDFYDFDS